MNGFLAFTLKSPGILDMLRTDTTITSDHRDESIAVDSTKKWNGLWDTGATKSSVDQRVVSAMGLIPVGKGCISTANGTVIVNTYLVNLTLPNHVTVQNILVTGADLGTDVDVLIGMDIIRHGDFSITNTNGATTFSFRIPSITEIDYVREANS